MNASQEGGIILLIDDNLANLKTLEALLENAGHKVRCAPNVRTAYMVLRAVKPDLILLDVRMPDMNGLDVCRRLKADPSTRNIPIIFISAANNVHEKVMGFEAGAVDYIEKPIQTAEVLARVKNHLENSRLQKALLSAYEDVEHKVRERTRDLLAAAEALQISMQTSEDIFRSLPTGLFIYQYEAPDHLVLYDANQEAEKLTGIRLQDVKGREFMRIWRGVQARSLMNMCFQVLREQRKIEIEDFYYRDNLLDAYFRINIFPMPQNRVGVAFENISEKKALAAHLEIKAAHLEEAQRIAHLGSWEYRLDSAALHCSSETERLLNGPVDGLESLLGKIHLEDRPLSAQLLERAQIDHQPKEWDFRVVLPDGRFRWLHCRCEMIHESHQPTRLAGTVHDITKEKNYEDLLSAIDRSLTMTTGRDFCEHLVTEVARASGADFVLLGERSASSPEEVTTLAVTNGKGILPNFSYALAGTPCREVLGGESCFYPANVQQLFPDDLLLAEMGINGYAGIPIHNVEGQCHGLLVALYRDALPDLRLLRSTLQVAGLRFAAEIQRQKSLGELESSRERFREISQEFRTLLDSIPDLIFRTAPDLRIVWGNAAVEKNLGRSLEDVRGRFCYEVWHQRHEACDHCPTVKCFSSGQPEFGRISSSNGRQWGIKSFPLLNTEGRVESVINLASDITERVRESEESARSARLVSIGELAAGVAHEINNPINGIINYAQLVLDNAAEGCREKVIAEAIMEEGERIAGIVRALLSFAKDQGEEKNLVELPEVIALCLNLTISQLGKDGINVVVNLPENMPRVRANRQQLQQVFLNLISNARYALNEKGSGSGQRRIEISGGFSGKESWIDVFDNGTGIAPRNLEKICNPFFTTKPQDKGTGLGLSISHGIVEDHGGKLLISSAENEWTRVRIALPVP